MSWLLNLKEKKYGRLTVIRRIKNDGKNVMWRCLCICGKYVNVKSASLVHNRTKSCGCLHREVVSKKPYYHIFTLLKRRKRYAKFNKEKKTCSLTFSEFLKFIEIKTCHYCADKVIWQVHTVKTGGNGHHSNLDRKDNDKGYSQTNCVVCCPRCNQMKRTLSYEEFYNFTAPIRESKL